jgi:hypothetical protein
VDLISSVLKKRVSDIPENKTGSNTKRIKIDLVEEEENEKK